MITSSEMNKKIKLLFMALYRIAKKMLKRFCVAIYKIVKWNYHQFMLIKRALHIIYIHSIDLTGEWLYQYGSQLLINETPLDKSLTKRKKKLLRVESFNIENDHSLVWSYSEAEDILSFISGWIETQIHSKWISVQKLHSHIISKMAAVAEFQLFIYRKIKIQQTCPTAKVYNNDQQPAPTNAISFTEAIRLKIMDKLHAISRVVTHLIARPISKKSGFLNIVEATQWPNHIAYYFQRE